MSNQEAQGEHISIRTKVIEKIRKSLSSRFRVFDNTGADKKIIAGQFPDVILFKKEPPQNDEILFVLKIENGGKLLDSLPLWKELGSAPSAFYIVVAKEKLDEAKKLVSVAGVRARFAWYEVVNDNVTQVHYE
ncbi:hypothetical protein KAI58_01395 [Candidatus Gracilibacteria bacterium]|nr:hypothetical protein [Candidatus Gracilibacteria bacterium]